MLEAKNLYVFEIIKIYTLKTEALITRIHSTVY